MLKFIGLLLANVPILFSVLVCIIFPPATFLKIFITFLLSQSFHQALISQTSVGIINNVPLSSKRTAIEGRILRGEASKKERIILVLFYFVCNLFDIVLIAYLLFVSGIILGIFKLIENIF